MITSTGNSRIRAVASLLKRRADRMKQNAFVIEGLRMVREAPADSIRELYLTEAFLDRLNDRDRQRIDSIRCEHILVTPEVMQRLSDTMHPQGILAVVSLCAEDPEAVFGNDRSPLVIVTENLQDPGNLGTIFRAGEGAGVTGLLLVGDTADPYNPKVVRGTMGSIFRMPFARAANAEEAAAILRKRKIISYAADLRADCSYEDCDYRPGTAFWIGNEGAGLTEAALAQADRRIFIPMSGEVESLNAGVSASVLAFEAARQRRQRPDRSASKS